MNFQQDTTAPTIAAVVVTRNRLALLQECLAAVRAQTRPPDEILVIDNGSDDGTREWLATQEGLSVIRQGNVGGAGGFHRGLQEAHARGHAWAWCMDDDTIPTPTALERLREVPAFSDERTGYLGSQVQWTDGSTHRMNMWYSAPGNAKDVGWYASVLRDRCVPSQTSSFVSILISRRAIEEVGLPIKEMFIWCDDAEYTHRITRRLRAFLVLDSVVVHKTRDNADGSLEAVSPKDYWKLRYGLRNEVYFRRVTSNSALGRVARVGFVLARHTIMLLKRRAPAYLLRALWSGLFFSPRPERVKSTPARVGGASTSGG